MIFKNQIKILENDLAKLKNRYYESNQIFVNKEILLFQTNHNLKIIGLSNFDYAENKKLCSLIEINRMTLPLLCQLCQSE